MYYWLLHDPIVGLSFVEKQCRNPTLNDCILNNLWRGSFAIIQGKCLV